MTPAERFFKARDAWLKENAFAVDPARARASWAGYVLARAAWDGYDAWRDARMELGG